MRGYPVKVVSNERSYDTEVAAKLWAVSEQLTSVRFDGFDARNGAPIDSRTNTS